MGQYKTGYNYDDMEFDNEWDDTSYLNYISVLNEPRFLKITLAAPTADGREVIYVECTYEQSMNGEAERYCREMAAMSGNDVLEIETLRKISKGTKRDITLVI